jgi:hypothetical protein
LTGVGKFIGGGILAIVGILGLWLSARAHDGVFAVFGFMIFGFAVLMLFRLIAISIDAEEEA